MIASWKYKKKEDLSHNKALAANQIKLTYQVKKEPR